MASFIETAEVTECPMLPIRSAVAFPGVPLSLELERKMSVKAFEEAYKKGTPILLLPQKDLTELPTSRDFYDVGTLCTVSQYARLPGGNVRILAVGNARASVSELYGHTVADKAWHARCVVRSTISTPDVFEQAYRDECDEALTGYYEEFNGISKDLIDDIDMTEDNGYYADKIAANLLSEFDSKIQVLLADGISERLMTVSKLLAEATELEKLKKEVHRKVRGRMDKNQRDYYLSEQLKVIKEELGEGERESDPEADTYKEKIEALQVSQKVKDHLLKELQKMGRMPLNSAEYGLICSYLDICLELPWNTVTPDVTDIKKAADRLDRDHDGLEKVKERIIEFLAVRQLAPGIRHQIICLVGPPGTGKTSVARSIADAMGRKYVRVSLGGVRDEADVRGHRKTYIGSMPGRIMEGIRRSGSRNPVMLLDEIDKLTRDSHGDPASALMEVLDPEQNKEFRDHFIELPFDLSDVMFIATANSADTIPAPLLDRMELIELKSYSMAEKMSIAKHHLIPKQAERHGLSGKTFRITDQALAELINGYTREAGVRNLEREIASLCRKAAKALVSDKELKRVSVTPKNLPGFIGPRKVIPETVSGEDEVGVVNGLAYTELGGALLKVEVAAVPGSGKLELTGSLGDVMKESAKAALTYIRSHTDEWKIDKDFYKEKDIHIHFPEGAVPKDGPSAGVTMVSALISELSGRPVKNTVAMTGEVTLRGKVLPIGGLKEKTMAAYKAGIKTVLIPKENERDLEDIDKTVRASLDFIPCVTVDDVLRNAIVDR